MSPDTIKQKCQERIRHLLHLTTDKLQKVKSHADVAYDVNPNLSTASQKLKAASSPIAVPSRPSIKSLDPTTPL
jgi:hypothetical protein